MGASYDDESWFDPIEDAFERIVGFTFEHNFNYISLGYFLLFGLQTVLYLLDAYVLITQPWPKQKEFNFAYVFILLIYLITCFATLAFIEPHQKRTFRIGAIFMTLQLFGALGYVVYAHFLTGNDEDIEYLFHYTHMMAPFSLSILIILVSITSFLMWKMSFFRSEEEIEREFYEQEARGKTKSA